MESNSRKSKGILIKPYDSFPSLNIGWLSLKDHFISTVGPNSGKGEALKNLLVIADAKIQPNSSFQKHKHEDMEILTWVISGTLHHMDNMGADQFVPPQSLQLMSARNGIFHAEGNSSQEELRILQIWISPIEKGGNPEVKFSQVLGTGLQLMAGPSKAALMIRQDLWLFASIVSGIQKFDIPSHQFGYGVFIGKLKLNQLDLFDGDGALLDSGEYEVAGEGQFILILQSTPETCEVNRS
jgi:redox-sensitive bicupin YhaK (pirin superfamily)